MLRVVVDRCKRYSLSSSHPLLPPPDPMSACLSLHQCLYSCPANRTLRTSFPNSLLLLLLSCFSRVRLCATPETAARQGSPISGILQARTLEWVAISFSNAWKWKVKGKSLSCVQLLATPWTAAHKAPPPMGFARQECCSGLPLPSLSKFPIHALIYSNCLSLSDSLQSVWQILWVHRHREKRPNVFPSLWLSNIPCTYYVILFMHSPADGRLGCFQVPVIVDSASVNIGMHVHFWRVLFLRTYTQEWGC